MSKHHCRACGQGVCGPCSSHIRPVPSRGWDHPVRVCDGCHARTETLWEPEKCFFKSTLLDDDASPETAALKERWSYRPVGTGTSSGLCVCSSANLGVLSHSPPLTSWFQGLRQQPDSAELRRCESNRLEDRGRNLQTLRCAPVWPSFFVSVCTALLHAAQSFFLFFFSEQQGAATYNGETMNLS